MEIDGPENDKARARNLNTTDATGRSDDALMSNEVEESERNASLNLVGHGQENGEGDEGNDRNVPEQTYWETEKKLMIPVHHLASPGDSPACSVRARGHPSPERQKDWAGSPCFGATSTSPSSGGRWNVVTPKSNSHPAGTRIRMVQHLGESGGYDELVVDFDDDLHRGIPPRGINRLRVDLIYVIPGPSPVNAESSICPRNEGCEAVMTARCRDDGWITGLICSAAPAHARAGCSHAVPPASCVFEPMAVRRAGARRHASKQSSPRLFFVPCARSLSPGAIGWYARRGNTQGIRALLTRTRTSQFPWPRPSGHQPSSSHIWVGASVPVCCGESALLRVPPDPAVRPCMTGHCSRYVGGCTALKDQVAHHARVLQQKVMKLQRGRRILVLAHSIGGYIVQEMTTWDPSLERSIIVGLLCPTLTQFKAKANRKIRFIAHPLVMAVSRFLLPLLRFFVSSFLTDQEAADISSPNFHHHALTLAREETLALPTTLPELWAADLLTRRSLFVIYATDDPYVPLKIQEQMGGMSPRDVTATPLLDHSFCLYVSDTRMVVSLIAAWIGDQDMQKCDISALRPLPQRTPSMLGYSLDDRRSAYPHACVRAGTRAYLHKGSLGDSVHLPIGLLTVCAGACPNSSTGTCPSAPGGGEIPESGHTDGRTSGACLRRCS
eukprot:GHVU01233167.1.p1 GENE.GHVU01233167.1~~GHVU01233167.1.p1  ORF type:complete len:668 (+),score=39.57 GHVU01233167.1:274-2277(+)